MIDLECGIDNQADPKGLYGCYPILVDTLMITPFGKEAMMEGNQ